MIFFDLVTLFPSAITPFFCFRNVISRSDTYPKSNRIHLAEIRLRGGVSAFCGKSHPSF